MALAGAVLFGTVYNSMVDSFEEQESLQLSEQEKTGMVIELEDTFQSISEQEELDWVADLPENTRENYREIVNKSAESGVSMAIRMTQLVLLLCVLLALALPDRKLEE